MGHKMAKMMKKMSMKKMAKKSMKMAKKSMKMRKMAMKKSIVGKRRGVFSGARVKTSSGLQKKDLKKNKAGKIVSRRASDAAIKAARKALGIKGFCPCGGKTRQGQALLAKTR